MQYWRIRKGKKYISIPGLCCRLHQWLRDTVTGEWMVLRKKTAVDVPCMILQTNWSQDFWTHAYKDNTPHIDGCFGLYALTQTRIYADVCTHGYKVLLGGLWSKLLYLWSKPALLICSHRAIGIIHSKVALTSPLNWKYIYPQDKQDIEIKSIPVTKSNPADKYNYWCF